MFAQRQSKGRVHSDARSRKSASRKTSHRIAPNSRIANDCVRASATDGPARNPATVQKISAGGEAPRACAEAAARANAVSMLARQTATTTPTPPTRSIP
jgi:hypothetical protein